MEGMPAFPKALLLAALASTRLIPQDTRPEPVFQSGVNMIQVDAQVLDGNRTVPGLTRDSFSILDEGQLQRIEGFDAEREPLRLVLLIDVSGSMKKLIEESAVAANKALARLQPQDQVAVLLFARSTLVHQDFTTDRKLAAQAIDDARYEKRPGSVTDINAAVIEAAHHLGAAGSDRAERRAIVIITDNQSMSYRVPDERVLEELYKSNAILTAMVTKSAKKPDPPRPGSNPDFTDANVFVLAEKSGGEVLRVERGAGEAFERAMERVRSRYSFYYRVPASAKPGTFREIEVKLTGDALKAHEDAEIRTRAGYFAP
jgi:VWFA-related protein